MTAFDLIVIGEGVAGMTAARVAAAEGLRVAMFEGALFGGLVTNVNALDPTPEPSITMGADYVAGLLEGSLGAGVHSIQHGVKGVAHNGEGFVVNAGEESFLARLLIIATGARFRPLGVPGEEQFAGHGVSHCADCDGPLFRKAEVVVAGGGDSALQEALVLAEHCARVHVVHHGAGFTGRADLVSRIAAHAHIVAHPDAEIERIEGAGGVERVLVRKRGTESRVELICKGVFAYIGLTPNTEFLGPEFARDGSGRLITDETLETSVQGVFAAGAVRTGCGGTIEDAVRDGVVAARAVAARAAA